jgi:hypothetical protein
MAGVSGPGKFSKRTDGLSFQPQEYGEGVQQAAIKSGAPLASTPDVRGATNTEIRQAVAQEPVTPLFAPSQRPDEPITAGIAMGPGPGPEVMGARPIQIKTSDTLAKLLPFDDTGEIAVLYQEALARGN